MINFSDELYDKEKFYEILSKAIVAFPKTVTSFAIENDDWVSIKNYHSPLNIDFAAHLKIIEEKLKFYEQYQNDANYRRAHIAAKILHEDLEAARRQFLLSTPTPEAINKTGPAFQKACLEAINRSRGELEQHRGWKEILANLASVFVSVLSLGTANFATGRSIFGLFLVKTDAAQTLDALATALEEGLSQVPSYF